MTRKEHQLIDSENGRGITITDSHPRPNRSVTENILISTAILMPNLEAAISGSVETQQEGQNGTELAIPLLI
ncbi:MAG: hypothetical protein AAF329_17345 [Cyanobacteria bacterium P01_A01_bin.17]